VAFKMREALNVCYIEESGGGFGQKSNEFGVGRMARHLALASASVIADTKR
jgi:hypothetical protein